MPISIQDIPKPKFNPNVKFEPVDDTQLSPKKPAFNPNAKFEPVSADQQADQSPQPETPLPKFPHFVNPNEFIQPSEKQPIQPLNINPNAATMPTSQDLHNKRVKDAEATIPKLLDTKEANSVIDELANSPFAKSGTPDNPSSFDVNMRPEDRQDFNQSKDIREAFKSAIRSDSPAARKILEDAKNKSNNPDFSKKINTAFAASDFRNGDVEKSNKLYNDIQSGKLGYDLTQKRPTIALHPAEAFIQGLEDHYNSVQLADDLADKSKDEIIDREEKKLKEYDPYKPIPTSNGWASTITNTAGQTAVGFEKAALGSMAGASTGNLSMVGNALGTLFISHDAGKQAAGQTFENSYRELRENGMAQSEAYDTALDQAKSSGVIAAGTMASMGYAGLKMGAEPLGGAVYGKGFKELLKSQLTNAKTFLKRAAPEVGVQGAIAGAGKALENINEGKPIGQHVLGTAAGAAAFVGVLSSVGAGAKSLTPKGREVAMNGLANTNPDLVEQGINQAVVQKSLTPEQADNLRLDLAKQRELNKGLPATTPEENKPKIQKLIQKRTDLENQLNPDHPSFLDPAFHKDIKEQINGVKKEKADGKMEGKDGINEQIRQLTEQKETPNFHEDQLIKSPLEQAKDLISEKVKNGEIKGVMKTQAEGDPEGFLKYVADQAHGATEVDGRMISSRNGTEQAYGSDLVDLATKIYPEHSISSPKIETNGKETEAHAETEGQIENQDAGQQTASSEKQHDVKLKENAIQEQSPSGILQHPQEGAGETGSERGRVESSQQGNETTGTQQKEGEITGEKIENPKPGSPEMTGITHAQMDETAREFGLEEYQKSPEKVTEWDEASDKRLREDPDAMSRLITKLRAGDIPDAVEQRMMIKYVSDLKAKVSKNPSNELLSKLKRAKDLSNITGGRLLGQSLVARKAEVPVQESYPDFLIRKLESTGKETLTEAEKKSVKDSYDDVSGTQSEYEKRIKDLESKLAAVKADKVVEKTKSTTSTKSKKTAEVFKKEREDIWGDIKKHWGESGGQLSATIVPYADRLVRIAPDVARLVKSYLEEGIDNLGEIVKGIHEKAKDVIPEITEKDIHNIIAGEHSEKKQTRNQLAAKHRELREEAKLINRLEDILNGVEPKTEKAKAVKSKKITELRDQIKSIQKEEADASKFYTEDIDIDKNKLASAKKKIEKQITEVNEKIAKGDFSTEEKATPILEDKELKAKFPELYKEAIAAKDNLIAAKRKWEAEMQKDEYAKMSKRDKFFDKFRQVTGIRRALNAAFDFSIPFRQGLRITLDPTKIATTAPAFKTMFQHTTNPKAFDRWLYDLENSSDYKNMVEDKLAITNPSELRISKETKNL